MKAAFLPEYCCKGASRCIVLSMCCEAPRGGLRSLHIFYIEHRIIIFVHFCYRNERYLPARNLYLWQIIIIAPTSIRQISPTGESFISLRFASELNDMMEI